MNPLILEIPTIAITGSSGKTTTREIIASILEQKWNVSKNTGNKNLPMHTQQIAESYTPAVDAILLELGMGKQGAGEKHCSYIQPNVSVITNIGTAHYGNLGNSIASTAQYKSALIKYMKQDGLLLLNNDDENSTLLDISTFTGKITTVGIIHQADYQASNIKYAKNGMDFQVTLDGKKELFFIPTFGSHNILNALVAIAIAHHFQFTIAEIRAGLANYQVPIKRLNFIELNNNSLLIDDTVNANPQSVKAAIDVLGEVGKEKKKMVVLGSMLELGEYTVEGHKEIGQYVANNQVDVIYTYGQGAKWIREGAIEAGFDGTKVRHFKSRDDLHREVKHDMEANSVVLVKGSSAMNMHKTVQYIKDRFFYSIVLANELAENVMYMSEQTLQQLGIESNEMTLHFGTCTKKLQIHIDETVPYGDLVIPQKLTNELSIPNLPYDYYLALDELFLGPVIGMLVYTRYMEDPKQQLLRFAQYSTIKGLIFLFRPESVNMSEQTITGYYYDPATQSFIEGTFPYPSVIFNRIPLREKRYQHFKQYIGENIFNYPYRNTNKLDFWLQMSKQPIIKKHLPRTKEYQNVNSLLTSLKICAAIYLKPATMAGGNGIFHLKKVDEGYVWSDVLGNKCSVRSKEELIQTLDTHLIKNKTYIIQEEIPSFTKEQHKIDFRVYFQKDYTESWKYSGMETKVGQIGSIISNSKNREKVVQGETALQEFYQLNEMKTKQKVDEITQLCIRVLKIMEKRGNILGDAAVDLVIDEQNKVWLLEVQLNYAAEIKANRGEDEQQVLPFILPTPFEYAKARSKF